MLLDPQPIGQLQSLTIKAMIVGIVALLSAFGSKLVISDDKIEAITQGILAAVALGSMVVGWWGRVRARQVVVPGVKGTKLLSIVLLAGLLVTATGCPNLTQPATTQPATQIGRLYQFKQIYTVALNGMTDAMALGLFSKDQIRTIVTVSGEIDAGIAATEKAIAAGDSAGAGFWLDRLNEALVKYLQLKSPMTTRPTTRPIGYAKPQRGEECRISPQLSRLLSRESKGSMRLLRFCSMLRPVTS